MYRYKFVEIPHNAWTGKPKERIELVVEEYAAQGWRLVQVVNSAYAMWYSGKMKSIIIFERKEQGPSRKSNFKAELDDSEYV